MVASVAYRHMLAPSCTESCWAISAEIHPASQEPCQARQLPGPAMNSTAIAVPDILSTPIIVEQKNSFSQKQEHTGTSVYQKHDRLMVQIAK